MDPKQKARVSGFLGDLLDGAADLGLAALPLLGLYKDAKKEGTDFWAMLLTDEVLSAKLVGAMQKHAARLPPSVVAGLKLVVRAHEEAKVKRAAAAHAGPSEALDDSGV